MKYNLEMNKMDYQKEKENRKKRLEAYAEEIQKSTLKKSAEVIEQLVEERHRQGMTQLMWLLIIVEDYFRRKQKAVKSV